jgi:hypothetical protein
MVNLQPGDKIYVKPGRLMSGWGGEATVVEYNKRNDLLEFRKDYNGEDRCFCGRADVVVHRKMPPIRRWNTCAATPANNFQLMEEAPYGIYVYYADYLAITTILRKTGRLVTKRSDYDGKVYAKF